MEIHDIFTYRAMKDCRCKILTFLFLFQETLSIIHFFNVTLAIERRGI